MITRHDILRSAAVLIKQHGEDAAIEAGMMADKFLGDGNVDGHRLWMLITAAICEMQRTVPREGEVKH